MYWIIYTKCEAVPTMMKQGLRGLETESSTEDVPHKFAACLELKIHIRLLQGLGAEFACISQAALRNHCVTVNCNDLCTEKGGFYS